MLLFRFSVLLISVGWLFLLPIYVQPNSWWWAGLLLTAWLIASWGSAQVKALPGEQSRAKSALGYLLVGGASVSSLCLLQAGLLPFYFRFASVYHSAWPLGSAIYSLLKVFGFGAAWQGDMVAVQTFREVIRFSITLEKLAFFPLLFVLIGEAVSLFLFNVRRMWRRLLLTAVCMLAYGIIRLVVLCAIFVYAQDLSLFWDPVCVLLSLAPLPLVLERFNSVSVSYQLPNLHSVLKWKPASATAMAVILTAIGFTGYLTYQDPGVKKQGRVLIDETHSNWEWATQPFDKQGFGKQSLYNYYLARDFANHYFHVQVNTDQHLTNQLLNKYDVLVVKTPTTLFAEDEKRTIYDFVRGGGGLFLVGDHTNLFGMSTVLNDLARPFRIRFNFDDTFALMTGGTTSYAKPRYLYHPLVRNLSEFGFETSCTLDVPLSAEFVMVGSGLGREWIDYSHKNFFGNIKLDPDEDYGLFAQAAAVKSGEGRVVAFSDSTVFSNFSLFWPGKPDFFLNALDYLNRKNRYGDRINLMLLAVGLVGLLGAIFVIHRFDLRPLVPLYTLLGGAAFLASSAWINHVNHQSYQELKPHTGYTTVAFESQYSDIALSEVSALLAEQVPEEHLLHEHEHAHERGPAHRDLETFRTFYINLARLGIFPTVKKSLHEALHTGSIVVVINPGKPFAEDDIHRLDHFLHSGGRVLLMDSIANDNLIANQLLRRFNARITFSPLPIEVSLQIPKPRKEAKENEMSGNLKNPPERNEVVGNPKGLGNGLRYEKRAYGPMTLPQLEVAGQHRPIFADDSNRLLAVEIPRGKGAIIVFVDSAHFSNAVMGRVYTKPTEEELRVYKDMFFLFENYLLKDTKEAEVETVTFQP
jgi:hypothetical protein